MIRCFIAAAACAAATCGWAIPGHLDPAFGQGGKASFRLGDSMDRVMRVLRQSDGKVVAIGYVSFDRFDAERHRDVALARWNADGTPDTAFGRNGLVRYHVANAGAVDAVIQPDDKVVVLARCGTQTCLVRFDTAGGVDDTFSRGGLFAGYDAYSLSLRGDGKFVGSVSNGAGGSIGAFRVHANGLPDASFGNAGLATAPAPGRTPAKALAQTDGSVIVAAHGPTTRRFFADGTLDVLYGSMTEDGTGINDAMLQPDGKLVLAGCGANVQAYLTRRLANGQPDPTFGNAGVAQPFGSSSPCVYNIQLQGDDFAVLRRTSGSALSVARVLDDGTNDASFGGFEGTVIPEGTTDGGLAVAPDGRILVGGMHQVSDFAVRRLLANGGFDTSFDGDGLATRNFAAGRPAALRAVATHGSKTIVLVQFDPASVAGQGEIGLLRLGADGLPDPTFGVEGAVMGTLGGAFPVSGAMVHSLAVAADGGVLVGGRSDGFNAVVKRFGPTGSPEFAVDLGATLSTHFGGITAIRVLDDGRIVVAGPITPIPPAGQPLVHYTLVARLMPDLSLDPTFNGGAVLRIQRDDRSDVLERVSVSPRADGSLVVGGHSRNALGYVLVSASGVASVPVVLSGNGNVAVPRDVFARANGGFSVAGHLAYQTSQVCGSNAFAYPVAFQHFDSQGLPTTQFLTDTAQGFASYNSGRLDAQDRMVAGGWRHNGCYTQQGFTPPTRLRRKAAVMRFAPGNAFDTGFGQHGLVVLGDVDDRDNEVIDVAVQSDGAIVAAAANSEQGWPFTVYRLQGGGASAPVAAPGDTDNDGIPDAYDANPLTRDNNILFDARKFADQQYRDFLSREADAAGRDFWASAINNRTYTHAQVIEGFFNSAEFSGTIAPVVRLYFAYFLRIPDYGGLSYWIGRRAGGTSLESISNFFAASPEFSNTYGSLGNGAFVDRVYQNVLGRSPDAQGRAFWVGQLDSGSMTRGQVMLQFSESGEYRSLIAGEVQVTSIYAGMLRRAPDAAGFAFWVDYLDQGNPMVDLINLLFNSNEYRARFL